MADRNEVVRYIIDTYYGGDKRAAAKASGCTENQITGWVNGNSKPQQNSIGWLLHGAVAPDFQVIAEYVPIETGTQETVRTQLRNMLRGHENASGLYAFYDSMANLIYIGKSDGNLFAECLNRLTTKLHAGVFPRGARQPETRLDVIRYVSAYRVQRSYFKDYAKHVESLILRISKPILNKNIGSLDQADAERG